MRINSKEHNFKEWKEAKDSLIMEALKDKKYLIINNANLKQRIPKVKNK